MKQSGQIAAGGKPSVFRNYLFNSLLTLANTLFPVLTYPWVNRVLGPEKIGVVNWASSIVSYFTMFAALGIPLYGMREIAKNRDKPEEKAEILNILVGTSLFMSVVCSAAFIATVWLVPSFSAEGRLFLVSGSLILVNAFSVDWYFQGMERYGYITARSIVFKVLTLGALLVFVRSNGDYWKYAAIMVIGTGGSNIVNFYSLLREGSIRKVSFRFGAIGRIAKDTYKLLLMNIAISLYVSANVIILGYLSPKTQVGYYSTAFRILQLCISFVSSLVVVLLPRMSRSSQQGDKREYIDSMRSGMDALLRLIYPILFGLALIAPEIVEVLGGEMFRPSIAILYIMTPIVAISGISNFLTNLAFIANRREGSVIIAACIGGVTSLILDIVLIPRLGGIGAGIAYLCAESAILAYYTAIVDGKLRVVMLSSLAGKHLASALAMCGAIISVKLLIPDPLISLFASILVGAVVYIGMMLIIMKDRYMLKLVASIVPARHGAVTD